MGKGIFFHRLFSSITESYSNDQYCDVKLFTRSSKLDFCLRPISCHSIVLCSIAPALTSVLNDVPVDPVAGMKCVYMPDLSYSEVQSFIANIYKGLSSDEFELNLSKDLATVLGIIQSPAVSDQSDSEMEEVAEEASGDVSSMLSDDFGSFNDERSSPANHSLTTPGRRGPSFNYQCPYKKCSKMFSSQSRRNVHILKTHRNPTGETPKDCQICGIKVSNNYEEHKRFYHKSKDCKECNITFNGVNAFLEHQRKIHGDIHTCQICKLKFPAKLKWLTHMRRSHDKRSDDDTLTPFLCDSCPKFFAVKKELLVHLKLDHSNKPILLKHQNSQSTVACKPTSMTETASTVT